MAGNINNTSVPIRVLCDLPAVITPSTEDKYEYNTQCGWYITPVTSGSRTVYIRNSRRGDVAAYDHLYYNPSTKCVKVPTVRTTTTLAGCSSPSMSTDGRYSTCATAT